jgi:predicted dehydrogenase
MKTVRWGLLSTANINRRVIPAIRASRRGELVAVASRDLERSRNYARKWDIPEAFGSYEAMLESGAVDAVYISLPNHLHARWSIQALRSGVHVLCEKPLAITTEEVRAMIQARDETGQVLAEAFMYRHHPQTKIAGEWVQTGRLGEIHLVRGVFSFPLSDPRNVRLVVEYGGGSLWDVGVYPLTLAQFTYGGPPIRVYGDRWGTEDGVDLTFTGQLHYPSGGLAQIASSFRAPYQARVSIVGTEGRLTIERPFTGMDQGGGMTFHPLDGEPVGVPVPVKELYLGQVEDMHAAVLDGAAPYLSLEESLAYVGTVQALYESARTGRVISIDHMIPE